jgi:hypothetical protein
MSRNSCASLLSFSHDQSKRKKLSSIMSGGPLWMNESVRRMDEFINEIVVLQKDRSFCLSLESRPKRRKKVSSMMSGRLRG